MRKSVLIISDYYLPHWTGLSKSIANLVSALEQEFDFTILTVKFASDLKSSEEIGFSSIVRVPYLLRISRVCYSPWLILRAISEIRKRDLILINSPCSNILPCAIIAKIFGKELVIFHQGDLLLREGVLNRVVEKVFCVCTRIACMLADRVSTYTADYAKNSVILKHFPNKLRATLLPLAKVAQGGSVSDRLSKLRQAKNGGNIIFGFGGRFVFEKGFDVLLRAAEITLKQGKRFIFAFAGETNVAYEDFFSENLELVSRIGENLVLLGLLNPEELLEFYSLIDFVVVPSRSDCFNLVQAEAALCAKPIIVSNAPGVRYLVQESDFGLIFESENPSDLARKLVLAAERRAELLTKHNALLNLLDPGKILESSRALLLGTKNI